MRAQVVVAVVFGWACGSDGAVDVAGRGPCNGQCVADPYPHCVVDIAPCRNGADCGSGQGCSRVAERVPCFSQRDSLALCRPYGFNRLLLKHGFDVGGMVVRVDSETLPAVVAWTAPEDARLVSCALFTCLPHFEVIGESESREHPLYQIDNTDACVYLFRTSLASEGAFALTSENMFEGTEACSPTAESRRRVISGLYAGCWAYDDYHIIAASDLIDVPLASVEPLRRAVVEACIDADGRLCREAGADYFGACEGGACRSWCRTSVDCALQDDNSSDSACAWECRISRPNELGLCYRLPPPIGRGHAAD
jgi:hypothetical protein